MQEGILWEYQFLIFHKGISCDGMIIFCVWHLSFGISLSLKAGADFSSTAHEKTCAVSVIQGWLHQCSFYTSANFNIFHLNVPYLPLFLSRKSEPISVKVCSSANTQFGFGSYLFALVRLQLFPTSTYLSTPFQHRFVANVFLWHLLHLIKPCYLKLENFCLNFSCLKK